MIRYISTRGDKRLFNLPETIIEGIAPDGGLFVPTEIPHLSGNNLKSLVGKSYQELCLEILHVFQTDFPYDLLREIINKSYSSNFDNPQIAPLVRLAENQYILELWHGPTSAFKDMALQIMPYFFAKAAKKNNQNRKKQGQKLLNYLILVATSGDTGKAALEGFKDKEGISIIVFYPNGHVSQIQELQMVTQEGNNVAVFGMAGDFDAVQRSINEVFNDKKFNQELLKNYDTVLSSANSINWGRLIPQIVYHISSYLDLVKKRVINLGDEIDIAVPTGNFGNILAAFYARKMGLPIRKLICASNENNVLTEFLQTGIYDINDRKLRKTPSPSMDIIEASNIERLLYEITKKPQKVTKWMGELKSERKFKVDADTLQEIKNIFYADWVSNSDCLKTIGKTYNESGYLLDPHTAVAQTVVDRYQKEYESDVPVVICSTAHWAKFAGDVYQALTDKNLIDDDFKIIDKITQLIPKATVPVNIRDLRYKKVRYTRRCEVGKDEVEKIISQYISK